MILLAACTGLVPSSGDLATASGPDPADVNEEAVALLDPEGRRFLLERADTEIRLSTGAAGGDQVLVAVALPSEPRYLEVRQLVCEPDVSLDRYLLVFGALAPAETSEGLEIAGYDGQLEISVDGTFMFLSQAMKRPDRSYTVRAPGFPPWSPRQRPSENGRMATHLHRLRRRALPTTRPRDRSPGLTRCHALRRGRDSIPMGLMLSSPDVPSPEVLGQYPAPGSTTFRRGWPAA